MSNHPNSVDDLSPEKRLLNEVLPDPVLSRQPHRLPPRERALEHLKKLAFVATTAGMALQLKGCVGFGVVDPMPDPVTCTEGALNIPDEASAAGGGHFVLDNELGYLLNIMVSFSSTDGIIFSGVQNVVGAEVTRTSTEEAEYRFEMDLLPNEGVTEVSGTVLISCDDDSDAQIHFTATWTGSISEETVVEVTLAY